MTLCPFTKFGPCLPECGLWDAERCRCSMRDAPPTAPPARILPQRIVCGRRRKDGTLELVVPFALCGDDEEGDDGL